MEPPLLQPILADMFELEKPVAQALVSKMIINEELMARHRVHRAL